MLVYYPLNLLTKNLGKDGTNVYAAMWLGNAVLGVAGLFLLWRLGRR